MSPFAVLILHGTGHTRVRVYCRRTLIEKITVSFGSFELVLRTLVSLVFWGDYFLSKVKLISNPILNISKKLFIQL